MSVRRLSALLLMMLAVRTVAARSPEETNEVDPNALVPNDVQPRISGKTVTLTARFAFDADGGLVEEAARSAALPRDGVVTGATATVGGVVHRLGLMPADEARETFEQLETRAPAPHREWALNITANDTANVFVDVAAATSARVTLELVVDIPSCFHRDRRYVALPAAWFSHLRTPRAAIHDASIGETCGELDDGDQWIAFDAAELSHKPSGEARIGTLAGLLPVGDQHIARVELDLASKLTDVPADLHTAIVVDTSRSLTADEIETQRAIVASYVQHLPPQSRVQIIAYARDATALLPAWLPAGAAAPRIDREVRALAPRNGSNVDRGIAEAGAWLAGVQGTRRMIVIGDEEFPFRIDEAFVPTLIPTLPAGTLVHAVDLAANMDGLTRIDGLTLGPLVQATEGIAVGAGLDANKIDAAMLVRPISIDQITISGAGWQTSDQIDSFSTCQREVPLAEGTTCTSWALTNSAVGPITLEASIWGHRIHRIMRADPLDALHLARELSTKSIFDDSLRQFVDQAAHAVNTAWSLFGTWGGTGGYSDGGGFGRSGTGGSCCDDIGVSDIGHGFGTGRRLDLLPQLMPAIEACHAKSGTVDMHIETTRDEIVDVSVTVSPADDAQRDCIVEHVWDTSLSIADAPLHITSVVHFKP